ncbi:Vitamin B12 import ATP-binding protein BtuD [Pseudomonas jessenii]|uniref:ATP-binding protein n=1 Tax=Pseudomonas jessenii TaxID=77298 RepID=UPI0039E16349
MKIVTTSKHRSIPEGISFDLPDFTVLTGKNGSGKSHLLEAIAAKNVTSVHIEGSLATTILHIGFNGLNPGIDDNFDPSQTSQIIDSWQRQIKDLFQNRNIAETTEKALEWLSTNIQKDVNKNSSIVIKKLIESTEKHPLKLTAADILNNISFTHTANNALFYTQLAMIFKTHFNRRVKNDLAKLRASNNKEQQINFLTDLEFERKYGPNPWNIINDIFSRANLPYEASTPELEDYELPFKLKLTDKKTGVDISASDLSSGEKVLLSLALAIYNTSNDGGKPELLLLDEPDAALHPQFSKLLIEILTEVIVKKAGIRVIITTHSPATVAMAPENSVFEIEKTTRTPFKIKNSVAVRMLTEGVDFLRVSFESRRQIFVEHAHDVKYFERIFNALSRCREFTFQPVFIEPHSGTSNCTDVITIVNQLRSTGHDLVWGVIDFDNHNTPNESIIVLGNGKRYAIENYILDPLYVCLCLIRNSKKTFADFGLIESTLRYSDTATLSQQQCQTIIDNFLGQINLQLDELTTTTLVNGYELKYPKSFLFHQGHDYEQKIKLAFSELGVIARGKGDAVLKLGVLEVIMDYPAFLPTEIMATFSEILEPAPQRT